MKFLTPLWPRIHYGKTQKPQESKLNWQDRQSLCRISIKLADIAGDLPQTLKLDGEVMLTNNGPIANGSFSDVFEGEYRGTKIAMKRLRIFSKRGQQGDNELVKVHNTASASLGRSVF